MEPVNKGWRLLSRVQYYSETIGQEIIVPAGFFTDLASVPRLFRWLVPVANAKNRKAAIVHDYLCTEVAQKMYGIDQLTPLVVMISLNFFRSQQWVLTL